MLYSHIPLYLYRDGGEVSKQHFIKGTNTSMNRPEAPIIITPTFNVCLSGDILLAQQLVSINIINI